MTYEEKFDIVVKAIEEVRKITPSDWTDFKLKITYENKLQDLDLDDTSFILFQLHNDYKVIEVVGLANTKNLTGLDPYAEEKDYFAIKILNTFKKWFEDYLRDSKKQHKYPNNEPAGAKPSRNALEKIWNLLQEIEEKRQIGSNNSPIRIPCYLGHSGTETDGQYEARKNILERLSSLGAINNLHKVKTHHNEQKFLSWSFDIGNNYQEVFGECEKQHKESTEGYELAKEVQKVQTENPVYEIRYSEQTREILINNFLLKQLRSFSDNDAIFAHLYKNPNQEQSDEDIKRGTGLDNIKDLNKFLDDIGFTGELRRTFFKVSKNKIRFNNPITKDYLKEIEIERLKLG